MSRDSYSRRQQRRAERIAEQALAEHPPGSPSLAEMSDDDLRARIAAGREFEKAGPLLPAWRRRLDALLAEQERRQIETGKRLVTIGPGYPWGDT